MGGEAQAETTLSVVFWRLLAMTPVAMKLCCNRQRRNTKDVVDPVFVVHLGWAIEVPLYLRVSARESEFDWRLQTEQGEVLEGYLQSQIVRDERAEGGPMVFALPNDLPLGYHTLLIARKRRKAPYEMTLIVTPQACYKQPALA